MKTTGPYAGCTGCGCSLLLAAVAAVVLALMVALLA